jgi:hypothetical protein
MGAIVAVAGHELRARWRAWVSLALLVAFSGGCVLATVAGARRTGSAYQRFLLASKASDVLVSPAGTGLDGYYQALARLPGIAAVAPIVGLSFLPVGPGGQPVSASVAAAPLDHRWGHLLDIPKVIDGRLPLAGRPGEVAVDQTGARALGVHVGSTLVMKAVPADQSPGAAAAAARRPPLRQRVVGIIVTRGSVHPVNNLDKLPGIFAGPALLHQLGRVSQAFDGAYVKLRPGYSPGIAGHQAEALAQRFRATGGHVFVADEGTQAAAIQRSIRPEAVSLALFALVLTITALLVVGQVATRLLAAAQPATPVLAALGMTRGQLMGAGLLQVGAAAAAGAVAAVGLAIAVSPLMPIGTARLAEPDPGVSVDAAVLTAGAVVIVVLAVARVARTARRLASGRYGGPAAPAPAGRSKVAGWLAGAGAPVTAAAGVRLALEPGRGRTAVPVRSALAGAALSVLAVTAAFTFGASLLHLVHTPRLYGQTWDAAVDMQFGSLAPQRAEKILAGAPGVTAWTYGNHGTIGIGGLVVPAIAVAAGRGPLLSPTLLAGRPPRTGNEIVLGTSTLRRIGRTVGQTVRITIGGHRQVDRIVGCAVFPNFGQGSFTPTDLGEGAETTAAGLRTQVGPPGSPPGYEFVLLRFAPGPRRAAQVAAFQRSMSPICQGMLQPGCVVADQRPNGATDYARIDGTPEALAVVLAVLGLAVLGQFIVVSGRRRRRDFAILRALGLTGRQVRVITAWQVSTMTGLALAAGIPLGVAAGHWSWNLFAADLGIPGEFASPLPLVLLLVPAVILAGNAVAFWPARTAARMSPARVLRAE